MALLAALGSAVYAVAMALVAGGTAALSFAAAPQTFRTLEAAEAGLVFGRVLRAFDRMAWVAAMTAVFASVVRMAERVTARGVALLVLAAVVQVLVTLLRRVLAPRIAALVPPEEGARAPLRDPEARRRFDALHRQYVRVYAANLCLSTAGLVLAALPA